MKRLFFLFFAAALLFSLVACDTSTPAQSTESFTETSPVTEPAQSTQDVATSESQEPTSDTEDTEEIPEESPENSSAESIEPEPTETESTLPESNSAPEIDESELDEPQTESSHASDAPPIESEPEPTEPTESAEPTETDTESEPLLPSPEESDTAPTEPAPTKAEDTESDPQTESSDTSDAPPIESEPEPTESTEPAESTAAPTEPEETEPACQHEFSEATCQAPETCAHCGETRGEKKEHEYTEAGCTTRPQCIYCGKKRGGTLGHEYKNGKCIRCEKADPYIRVTCVGDSITAGGYWNKISSYLGSTYSVAGYGASGSTGLASGLDGYPNSVPLAFVDHEQHQNALKRDSQIVVIMLGTNDSKPMNANQIKADNGEQYKKDMIALVRAYQELECAPQVFLALPPVSYRPETEHGMSNVNIETLIIPILETVAKETGAIVIDTHTATENAKEAFPDGVHPNDDGKDILAKTVAEAILAWKRGDFDTQPENPAPEESDAATAESEPSSEESSDFQETHEN